MITASPTGRRARSVAPRYPTEAARGSRAADVSPFFVARLDDLDLHEEVER